MRVWVMAAAVALTIPALADGFGSQQSTTTTQTTTSKTQSGDTTTTTTTTRTETESSGGGFSFGGMFNKHHDGGPSYDSIGGSWKIGDGSKLCDLTLEKSKFISNYGARTGIGCPEGLFGVSSWMLAGDEIRLMSPAGSLLAKLHSSGSGRWNGRTEAGLEIFMTRN